MRIDWMGDRAVVLTELPAHPAMVAAQMSKLFGVLDAVPTQASVGVYFDEGFTIEALEHVKWAEGLFQPKTHTIPVCYGLGEELGWVAERLKMSPDELIEVHCRQPWPCFAIGFCPGFAYLGPVASEIQGVPRLPTPRLTTPPGSVGLTGSQTAVYPLARPGGWPIIGMTPLTLVDVASDYFPIRVGDSVQFEAIDEAEFARLRGERL